MTRELEEIRAFAKELGACRLVENIKSWKTLAETLLSPQGIEFVAKHVDERMIALFRAYKGRVRQFGIHVDSCRVTVQKSHRGAFIGKMTAVVECRGTEEGYTFVVMDGATLIVSAEEYAVVRIYNLGGEVDVRNDGTAIIMQ